jgi:hypothetical protein
MVGLACVAVGAFVVGVVIGGCAVRGRTRRIIIDVDAAGRTFVFSARGLPRQHALDAAASFAAQLIADGHPEPTTAMNVAGNVAKSLLQQVAVASGALRPKGIDPYAVILN